jgi:catechol 2,3-dioxygenase-like lactoylglutathione lyase family enzyme
VPIIPQIRCSRFAEAFEFYTKVLDFEYVEGDDPTTAGEAAYCVLSREGAQIGLSDFDGGTRSVLAVMTNDVEGLFRKFRARGLQTPGDPNVPRLGMLNAAAPRIFSESHAATFRPDTAAR